MGTPFLHFLLKVSFVYRTLRNLQSFHGTILQLDKFPYLKSSNHRYHMNKKWVHRTKRSRRTWLIFEPRFQNRHWYHNQELNKDLPYQLQGAVFQALSKSIIGLHQRKGIFFSCSIHNSRNSSMFRYVSIKLSFLMDVCLVYQKSTSKSISWRLESFLLYF